jgi:hypothetical protein
MNESIDVINAIKYTYTKFSLSLVCETFVKKESSKNKIKIVDKMTMKQLKTDANSLKLAIKLFILNIYVFNS